MSAASLRHVQADALDPNLGAFLELPLGSVAAAVCNPPFIRPRWRRQFGLVLEAAGLSACYPAIEEAGAAVLFLAQNLRFLRRGGQAGVILPDGIVSGRSHEKLRQTLLEQHCITDVIELPRSAFLRAQVRTHIVILRKEHGGADAIRLRRFDPATGLSSACLVDIASGAHRLDYSYYVQRAISEPKDGARPVRCIRDVALALERGRGSTSHGAALPHPLFHTTSFPASKRISVPRRARWTLAQAQRHGQTLAWPGDILIGRVGRNLHRKIGLLAEGPVAISDCVYRLRVNPAVQRQVLAYLASPSGSEALASITSGSGARHLSKVELLDLPIPSVDFP